MKLFRNIRLKIAHSRLSRKSAKLKRKVTFRNLNSIKSIGIVWDASKPEDFPVLAKFYQKMQEKNTSVTILGYFPGAVLPDQYTALRYLTCIKKPELDFFFIPKSKDAEIFIQKPFDILIDINFDGVFPLLYIYTLSNASLKVGIPFSDPETSPFDLMIDIKKPVSVDKYLDQVLHYLNIINSEPVKTAV